jgi:hypothetical protein
LADPTVPRAPARGEREGNLVARKRLKGGPRGLPAPRLTKAQTKILRKFSDNAKQLAKRLRQEARDSKSELVKANRPTIRPIRRGVLTKTTKLNTWLGEESKARARIEVTFIKSGKNKGKFKDSKTGKYVDRSTINRRSGAYRYHATVRHLHKILGGKYATARKAYKAFLIAGILKAIEFES